VVARAAPVGPASTRSAGSTSVGPALATATGMRLSISRCRGEICGDLTGWLATDERQPGVLAGAEPRTARSWALTTAPLLA